MTGNLYSDLPASLPAELTTVLATAGPVRVERIVSTGQATAPGEWYDQDEWEFVVLLSGSATLAFDDGNARELSPGDWLAIPAHVRHRVERTSTGEPTVWLAIFAPGGGNGG